MGAQLIGSFSKGVVGDIGLPDRNWRWLG